MNIHRYPFLLGLLTLTLVACQGSDPSLSHSEANAEELPVSWQAPQTVATGNAEVGPWRMNESEFHYIDDATVELHQDRTALAWVDNENQDVLLQVYDDNGQALFEQPSNVSRSGDTFSWLPVVRMADQQNIYVLWQEIVFSGGSHGGEIFFARSDNGGQSFSDPINLSDTTAGAGKGRLTEEQWDNGSLDLLLGRNGELFVAWTEYEGGLYLRRSDDAGQSFSEAVRVNPESSLPARAPTMALTPDHTLYLAWAVGEDSAANIHFARSEDGGQTFATAQEVLSSQGHADTPALAADNEGRVHLLYGERSNGPSGTSQVYYTRLDNRTTGAETEPTAISEHTGADYGARAPAIKLDQDGRIFVVWEHHQAPEQRARGLGFALSTDGGASFTAPAEVPGSAPPEGGFNGSLQGALGEKLAVDNSGQLAVVNSHLIPDERSEIVLIRGQWYEP